MFIRVHSWPRAFLQRGGLIATLIVCATLSICECSRGAVMRRYCWRPGLIRAPGAELFASRFGIKSARSARLSRPLADHRFHADQLSALPGAFENARRGEGQERPENRDRFDRRSAGHYGHGGKVHHGQQNHRDRSCSIRARSRFRISRQRRRDPSFDTPHWFAIDPSGMIVRDWNQAAADTGDWVKDLDQLMAGGKK